MLLAERYSNYRYAKQKPPKEMPQRKQKSSTNYPDDIEEETARSAAVRDLFAERPEDKPCEFECLPPYWDSYNRDAAD